MCIYPPPTRTLIELPFSTLMKTRFWPNLYTPSVSLMNKICSLSLSGYLLINLLGASGLSTGLCSQLQELGLHDGLHMKNTSAYIWTSQIMIGLHQIATRSCIQNSPNPNFYSHGSNLWACSPEDPRPRPTSQLQQTHDLYLDSPETQTSIWRAIDTRSQRP